MCGYFSSAMTWLDVPALDISGSPYVSSSGTTADSAVRMRGGQK